MSTVIASAALANGLRSDFKDNYLATMNRASSKMLDLFMGTVQATNRTNEFAYPNAAPHALKWTYGDTMPGGAFDFTAFSADAEPFALKIEWHKYDLRDERTGTLYEMAQQGGASFGLVRERIAFDLLLGTTNMLSAVPLAPDGATIWSATDGASAARFGATGGNIVSGSGVSTTVAIQTNYYSALNRFGLFQDGKGQPLLSPETIASGVVIVYGIANQMIFEQAFKQVRQGVVLGTDAGTTPTNVVQDASRNVQLWPTPRITDNDWYIFLLNPPKKPLFEFLRDPLEEHTALVSDNNSDRARNTGIEGIYWDMRTGGGVNLPYAGIQINN